MFLHPKQAPLIRQMFQLAELSVEIVICQSQGNDSMEDEVEVDAVLSTAERIFSNTAMLWTGLTDVGDRHRFQNAMFPEGLAYTMKTKFGTGVSSPFINELRPEEGAENEMARPRGIEPRFQG